LPLNRFGGRIKVAIVAQTDLGAEFLNTNFKAIAESSIEYLRAELKSSGKIAGIVVFFV